MKYFLALPFIVLFILALMPLWVFLIPLIPLVIGAVGLRKHTRARGVCIVLTALVIAAALPAVAREFLTIGAPEKALEAHFGTTIPAHCIVKYKHHLVGLEDHNHHWKLTGVDIGKCNEVIQKYGLKPADGEHLFSRFRAPKWWAKSKDDYRIFEGDDGHLGSREIWVPKEGSTVYLFKFTE
jgi:hypothetical protein